jgi:NAD(P)H dehydrogenase (quinone)
MKVFIVYAHPEPKSFNGAMKDLAVETLRQAGHEVVVSDLYAMGFHPVVGANDFLGERADPDFLSIATEQTKAFRTGTLAPDIVVEQEQPAHPAIPIWWFGMPAILKGWADRVLRAASLMARVANTTQAMFRGKTAMVAATVGAPLLDLLKRFSSVLATSRLLGSDSS